MKDLNTPAPFDREEHVPIILFFSESYNGFGSNMNLSYHIRTTRNCRDNNFLSKSSKSANLISCLTMCRQIENIKSRSVLHEEILEVR